MGEVAEPWAYYSRAASVAGWTFALGQGQIREALLAADVQVKYLSLGGGYDGGPYGLIHRPRPRTLIRAWWSTDTNPYRRAPRGADGRRSGWSGLDLYAVRSAQAAEARALLLSGLLSEVVGWIDAIDTNGDGWRASDHELVVLLDEGTIHRRER